MVAEKAPRATAHLVGRATAGAGRAMRYPVASTALVTAAVTAAAAAAAAMVGWVACEGVPT